MTDSFFNFQNVQNFLNRLRNENIWFNKSLISSFSDFDIARFFPKNNNHNQNRILWYFFDIFKNSDSEMATSTSEKPPDSKSESQRERNEPYNHDSAARITRT